MLTPFYRRHERLLLTTVLLLGLLVRLPFLHVDFNAFSDLEEFRRWGRAIYAQGLAEIYSNKDVIYPPVLLYLFGAAATIEAQLPSHLRASSGGLNALIKLPAILADVLTAWLIAWALRKHVSLRLRAGALYALNPAIWYVSVYWGQMDSVYTLFLVASVLALARGAVLPAWGAYALAVGTKFQSVVLAPLLIIATLVRYGWRGLGRGMVIGAAVEAILVAPWLVLGKLDHLVRVYTDTLPDRVPLVDVSAYNLWYFLHLGNVYNLKASAKPAGLPLSYQQIGFGLFAAFVLLVVFLVWKRRKGPLALPAALLSLGIFLLLTQMHERYLFPAVAFLLLAALEGEGTPAHPEADSQMEARNAGLWWVFYAVSLTFLFNLVTIAPFTPGLGRYLASPNATYPLISHIKSLAILVGIVNSCALIWLMAKWARRWGARQKLSP